ncbi:unnamed protein product [Effrenium voratum]|uniref:Uncharacterized protein n=1 Tax=Effrenium voratum TaxID=2562239 RepID=A0AA36MMY3_9DINO|nr:unnamed protein product [Effrenium voratum]
MGCCVFKDCSSLASVTIPDSVTQIDFNAFAGCGSLASVTIPDSVERILTNAFKSCVSLTCVTVPDCFIEEDAFAGCSALTLVVPICGKRRRLRVAALTGCKQIQAK